MQKIPHHEKGFTLIEILIVLSITLLISSFVIIIGKNTYEKFILDEFFSELKTDILSTQSYSLGYRKYTQIYFSNGGTKYVGRTTSNDILVEKTLPKGIKLHGDSPLKSFGFHPNGSVDSFGKLIFVDEAGEIHTVTLQIGRGRVKLPE